MGTLRLREGRDWSKGTPRVGCVSRAVDLEAGRAGAVGRGLRGPLPAPGAPLAAGAPLGCRVLRAKTNTSHKRPLCGADPRPPAPPPPGQSRLCARPAAPVAQAILISVWVCAGRWESKPPFFQRPRLPPPGSPGLRVPLLAAAGSGAFPGRRLEFESRLLQPRDPGYVLGALSLSFPINNSTHLVSQPLTCGWEGLHQKIAGRALGQGIKNPS